VITRTRLNVTFPPALPDVFTIYSIVMVNAITPCGEGVKKKSCPSPPTEPHETCFYCEIDMEVSVIVRKPSLHPSDKLLGRGYHVAIICHNHQPTASVMQRSYMSVDSSSCSINKLVSYDTTSGRLTVTRTSELSTEILLAAPSRVKVMMFRVPKKAVISSARLT
jgi:hypothetical protein